MGEGEREEGVDAVDEASQVDQASDVGVISVTPAGGAEEIVDLKASASATA